MIVLPSSGDKTNHGGIYTVLYLKRNTVQIQYLRKNTGRWYGLRNKDKPFAGNKYIF